MDLFLRDGDLSKVKEQKNTRSKCPNFRVGDGEETISVVGAYILPTNLTTIANVENAWRQCPKECKPMLIVNLNVNLGSPRDERDTAITARG